MHTRYLWLVVLMACPQSEEVAPNTDSGVVAVDASSLALDTGLAADTGSPSASDTGAPDSGEVVSDSGVQPAVDAGINPNPDTGLRDDAGSEPCRTENCPCEEDAQCRFDHYCNNSPRPGNESTCQPLPDGACRTDESCLGICERTGSQRIGRCNDCRVDADCESNELFRERCVDNACQTVTCAGHADCEASQQCMDIDRGAGVTLSCVPRCNSGRWAAICRAVPQQCICNSYNLACDFESGLCQ